MRRSLPFVFLLSFVTFAQKKPVTIDAVVSQPASTSGFAPIVWAPDGKRFAWLEDDALWLYDVPSTQKRQVAALKPLKEKAIKPPAPQAFGWQNRRVTEREFQWYPSGDHILVQAEGDLFEIEVASGSWNQLTSTNQVERDPKISPDGKRVSFRLNHDLQCLEIATRKIKRLTQDGSDTLLNAETDWVYPEELDLGTAHWWAPDSSRIAYLQFDVSREWIYPQVDLLGVRAIFEPQRFPQPGTPNADVRLGVVQAGGGRTRWMDLGQTRDYLLARVYWTPDSKGLFAERLNRIQNRLELHEADATTGSSRVVLREEDPYWINVNDLFQFVRAGNEFLWGSERDGYQHLYLYTREGKLVRQITRGEWEVSRIAGVEEASGDVFYVSSEESPLERHLYRIQLDGSTKRKLTEMAGTHAISMSPTAEYYMDTASSLTQPPRRTLYRRGGEPAAVFRAPDSLQYEVLPEEIVTVKASDGAQLHARLIKPAGFESTRKYPVIVIVYGGPQSQAVRNAWSGITWDQALAQSGFLVWQLDNRGSAGRGHAWESKVFRNLGAVELQDQQEGIRFLESLGFADTSRMGIYGWSYGGFMTLYALTHAPALFRAGVAGAPVTDWRLYDTIYTERYMGLPQENEEAYRRSAPLSKAGSVKAKLMLVHNFEDDNVHFQHTLQMVNALERAGKEFELVLYGQKTHAVDGREMRKHLLNRMTRFFEESLTARAAGVSTSTGDGR